MIGRDRAVQLVEEILEQEQRNQPHLRPLAVFSVVEHELVWVIEWQSDTWVRTRDPMDMLAGTGPYLVDREDGSVHFAHGLAYSSGEWDSDYRYRVKGLSRPTGPDLLAIEVRQILTERGKVTAMRHLRRAAPQLTLTQAQDYASAIQAGQAPPPDLAALTKPKPIEPHPIRQVKTITGPNPPQAVPVACPIPQ